MSFKQKNECAETGMCENGRCLNLDGGFRCFCSAGYKLDPTGKHCIGMFWIFFDKKNLKMLITNE